MRTVVMLAIVSSSGPPSRRGRATAWRRPSAPAARPGPRRPRRRPPGRRVYSRRVLDAAGPGQRAALAARLAGTASGAAQRLRVAAFQGVFATGDQAIAILDYARGIRVSRGSRWRELPAERWQVALRREGRTWRFERGLER